MEYYKLSVSGEKQFEGKLSEIFLTLENMGTNAILLSLCFKCFNYRFMICFYSLKTLRLPETMYKSIHVWIKRKASSPENIFFLCYKKNFTYQLKKKTKQQNVSPVYKMSQLCGHGMLTSCMTNYTSMNVCSQPNPFFYMLLTLLQTHKKQAHLSTPYCYPVFADFYRLFAVTVPVIKRLGCCCSLYY